MAGESDMSATDSCEEVGEECPSEVDPDAAVVNLDCDKQSFDGSGNSCTSSTESSDADDATTGGHAAGGPPGEHASGDPLTSGATGPVIFDNGYFYINANKKDLKAFVYPLVNRAAAWRGVQTYNEQDDYATQDRRNQG